MEQPRSTNYAERRRSGRAWRVNESRSLGNFQSREWNEAFGLAARVGQRGADQRPEKRAEWSGGLGNLAREHQWGERESDRFQDVVWKGN